MIATTATRVQAVDWRSPRSWPEAVIAEWRHSMRFRATVITLVATALTILVTCVIMGLVIRNDLFEARKDEALHNSRAAVAQAQRVLESGVAGDDRATLSSLWRQAQNELGHQDVAAAAVNQLRARARNGTGSENRATPADIPVSDQATMRTAILNERRIELAFEGDRWFDQVREGFDYFKTSMIANDTTSVPANLTAVASVLGLNDAARMSLPTRKADTGLPNYLTSYTPQGFWKAYDATTAPTGARTPIAIFAEGDVTGVVNDLRTEETADGLAKVPVSVVKVGLSSPDTAGADEWDMDTQFSAGMAGGVSRLYLYDTTSLTDADITLEFSRFASDDRARAGSASFGECEYQAYLDGSMIAMDNVFQEAAVQGQTVFASSGDTGGFCPVVPDNGAPAGAPALHRRARARAARACPAVRSRRRSGRVSPDRRCSRASRRHASRRHASCPPPQQSQLPARVRRRARGL